jgi:glycosyltransferase involved in cell wall biosynthesis
MRIAQVAPLYESVPPKLYGGTERVVSWLTEELVRLGHEVTLFASGDSLTTAQLVPACPQSLRLNPSVIDQLAHHVHLVECVCDQKQDFDLIHFHIDYLHFPLSRREQLVQVSTLHGRLDIPDLLPIYRRFSDMPVISISNAQRAPLPWVNWQGTVQHGLPEAMFSPSSQKGEYLAFLGRTSPEKGLEQAVAIAKGADMPLKIAAKVDRADIDYFEGRVKPLLDPPRVEFLGEIGFAEKNEFLGKATALLFPIDWPEPFGIVMIEALACGIPVIAFRRGSVPEIIEDGITGFVVRNVEDAIKAVRNVEQLSRPGCRARFEKRFTAKRMTEDYLATYERILSGSTSLALTDGDLSWMKLESRSSTT